MNRDRIGGAAKQAKGPIKEATAKVTGDAKSRLSARPRNLGQGAEWRRRRYCSLVPIAIRRDRFQPPSIGGSHDHAYCLCHARRFARRRSNVSRRSASKH